MTIAEIIRDYPYIEEEDIRQALRYAAHLAEEEVHPSNCTLSSSFLQP
jgi:uncharacterized protein (DUF433 family)